MALSLAVVALGIVGAPFPPGPLPDSLDGDWMLALNAAHARGFVWGRDLVFSYGPLGFLRYADPSCESPGLVRAFQLGTYGAWLLATAMLLGAMPSTAGGLAAAAVMAAGLAMDPFAPRGDRLDLLVLSLALRVAVPPLRPRLVATTALGVVSGLALLVKLDTGIQAVALLLVVAVLGAWAPSAAAAATPGRGRWLAATCAIAAASMTFLTLLALLSGGLRSLGAYLSSARAIVTAYPLAMGSAGPRWELVLMTSLTGMLAVVPLVAARSPRRPLPYVLPTAVLAIITLRHATVRQDAGHTVSLPAWLALSATFLVVGAEAPRERVVALLLSLGVLLSGSVIVLHHRPFYGTQVARRIDPGRLRSSFRAHLRWADSFARRDPPANLRLPPAMQARIGSHDVDAVPWGVARIVANGWRWSPRPVLQDYSAYTPELDAWDARHVLGPAAAPRILLSWPPAEHHPFLQTPALWRALLDGYDASARGGGVLLLERRASPRFGPPEDLGGVETTWGDEVALPDASDGLLVMSARMRLSLRGKLRTALLRGPRVDVVARSALGTTRWRATWTNLSSGAVVGVLPGSLAAVQRLMSGSVAPEERIIAIRLESDHPDAFASTIDVRWSLLRTRAVTSGGAVPSRERDALAAHRGASGKVASTSWRRAAFRAAEERAASTMPRTTSNARSRSSFTTR